VHYEDGPRVRMKQLLTERARSLGLGRESIDVLVRHAEFVPAEAGRVVCSTDHANGFARLPLSGVLKLVCYPQARAAIVVRFLPPAALISLPVLRPDAGYRVAVVAHARSLVALIDDANARRALAGLRDGAFDFAGSASRTLVRWLCEKSVLLRCSVLERLRRELPILAATLPARSGDGTEIAARITHDDLAALIGATRSSVSRAMHALSAAGLVRQRRYGAIVVSRTLLDRRVEAP